MLDWHLFSQVIFVWTLTSLFLSFVSPRIPSWLFWGALAIPVLYFVYVGFYAFETNLYSPDASGNWNLAHHNWNFSGLSLFRPPWYPWFLSLFPKPWMVSIAQSIIFISGLGLAATILLRNGFSPSLAGTFFLVGGFSSLLIQSNTMVLDMSLVTILLLLVSVLFLQLWYKPHFCFVIPFCFCSGLLLSSRSIFAPSLAILIFVLLVKHYRKLYETKKFSLQFWSPVFLLLLILVIPILRNGFTQGVWKSSVAFGVNSYTHASYYMLENPNHAEWQWLKAVEPNELKSMEPTQPQWEVDISWRANNLPHAVLDRLTDSLGSRVQADKILGSHAIHWAINSPVQLFHSWVNELKRLLFKCEEFYPDSLVDRLGKHPPLIRRAERPFIFQPLWALLLIGGLGLMMRDFRRGPLPWIWGGALVYLMIVPMIQLGFTRYGFPVIPVLILCAVASGHAIAGSIWNSYRKLKFRMLMVKL